MKHGDDEFRACARMMAIAIVRLADHAGLMYEARLCADAVSEWELTSAVAWATMEARVWRNVRAPLASALAANVLVAVGWFMRAVGRWKNAADDADQAALRFEIDNDLQASLKGMMEAAWMIGLDYWQISGHISQRIAAANRAHERDVIAATREAINELKATE
jgi:hypothetical protein